MNNEMDLKQYMEQISEMKESARRQRCNDFLRAVGVLVVIVLAVTMWSFLMAVLAVKVVTG